MQRELSFILIYHNIIDIHRVAHQTITITHVHMKRNDFNICIMHDEYVCNANEAEFTCSL